jgi:ATP-dependent RNA helicase HelY
MTTEVLRNMMYAASPDLETVGAAILDEVHYLADRARGPVWEEIIVHLDPAIPLVCLSATVANAAELADWVRARRGATTLVVEATRPVPLDSEYLIRDRWEGNRLRLLPVFDDRNRPNDDIVRMLRRGRSRGQRYVTPRRFETAELLGGRGLLPAIFFIFSRAGCDAAARQVVDFGLQLTEPEESDEIRARAAERTGHLSDSDLNVLGYPEWVEMLAAGVAAHHAGLVPAFKETVEHLFASGLVRLVFATETLALGINMPARTVVLENLSKFTGDGHELLQPGDYTQLTGRAGRRGIDVRGTAVVLHSPYVPFERAAAIAGAGSHPLRSSFAPTYNMAANLIARYPQDRAEDLLNASFAQFGEDRRRDRLEESLAEARRRLLEEQARAACELGDPAGLAGEEPPSHTRTMAAFAARTGSGDVLEWTRAGRRVRQVVVARGRGKAPRMMTVDEDGALHRQAPDRLPPDAARVGRISLPTPFAPREAGFRSTVAQRLRDAVVDPAGRDPAYGAEHGVEGAAACPDVAAHLEAARAARRSEHRIARLERRLGASQAGLVPQFRAIRRLLERWGYVDGWALTPRGNRLRFIYNELDLLLTEVLERGMFEGLEVPEAAALASAFTFEPRNEPSEGRWPTRRLERAGEDLTAIWMALVDDERAAGLAESRPPDAGFAETAYRWAAGEGLQSIFGDETGRVGDFVRNCRQVIDLLRQIRDTVPEVSAIAAEAAQRVDRGVVAAAGAV